MSELTTGEIVKMVMAVLVLLVVVVGAYYGYTYYFKTYFEGLGPSIEDYNAKNIEIVKSKPVLAVVTTDSRNNYITFTGDKEKSEYYICKGCQIASDGEMFKDDKNPVWLDEKVGFVDSNGQIKIISKFLGERIGTLNDALKSFSTIAK